MNFEYINDKLKYEVISNTEGLLIIEDLKEGVGTTYGTALRRSILHSDIGYDVIGICINGGKATNIFGSIDSMENTILDLFKVIKKAKYIIKDNSEKLIEIGFSGDVSEVRMGDLANELVSVEDKNVVVCKFTREVPVDIRVILYNSSGANSVSFNQQVISKYSGDTEKWLILDSCHGDVITVGFSSEVELGLETIKLRVKTKSKKPIESIKLGLIDLVTNFAKIYENVKNIN